MVRVGPEWTVAWLRALFTRPQPRIYRSGRWFRQEAMEASQGRKEVHGMFKVRQALLVGASALAFFAFQFIGSHGTAFVAALRQP